MHAIVLGGEKPSNQVWAAEMAAALQPDFETTTVFYYQHWLFKTSTMDIGTEAARLAKETQELAEPYAVVAKSAGCWAVLSALMTARLKPSAETSFTPDLVVLAGVPALPSRRLERGVPIDAYLMRLQTPALFMQQTNDPTESYNDLAALLSEYKVPNYQLVEVPGDDHQYTAYQALAGHITAYQQARAAEPTPLPGLL
jgi:hypothetical protein